MNKEKLITIVIGLTVGILGTGAYFAAVKILPTLKKPVQTIVPPEDNTPKAAISGANSLLLTLDKPGDNSATMEADLKISGSTAPAATLVIFSNADERIASADASGKFIVPIKLEDGENEISVTSFLGKQISQVVHRNVTLEINQ